jgi:preprotein translocase subunit YajC
VGGFLIIILLFAAVWLIFVLPARRRRMSHSAMQDGVVVGDDVITAGGIHGTIREFEDDLVRLEIAPGVVVTLDRRAVAAVAKEIEVETEAPAEPEADPGTSAEPR